MDTKEEAVGRDINLTKRSQYLKKKKSWGYVTDQLDTTHPRFKSLKVQVGLKSFQGTSVMLKSWINLVT